MILKVAFSSVVITPPIKYRKDFSMASKDANVKDLFNYMTFPFADWYVGITNDPEERLFTGHNLDREDKYIVRQCSSDDIAREIEQYFLNLGCDGGPGGGNETSVFVYAYKKTSNSIDE